MANEKDDQAETDEDRAAAAGKNKFEGDESEADAIMKLLDPTIDIESGETIQDGEDEIIAIATGEDYKPGPSPKAEER